MADNKKDLTRIEDLGEFIHELNQEEEETTEDAFGSSELPDLPSDEDSPFGSDDSSFSSSEESTFGEDSETNFGETDFGSSFESDSSESSFESNDFGSSDFETSSEFPETSSFDEVQSQDEETTSFETSSSFEEPAGDDFLSTIEDEPAPVIEETSSFSAPEPVAEIYTPSETYKAPENFEDVKKFAESSSFTGMGAEGNPSFSLLIKNVRYIEDVNDILTLLKELKLLADSEEQIKNRLLRGTLLVPRISEFAAIFLAHKLRRFDIDIQVGLSDEIHPPKHQETPETGLVSKMSLYQNQTHHFHFDDPKLEISQIIVAATSTLDGYQVLRYMGVASEHKMLESDIVENEDSDDVPRHYQELAQKLKAHALKSNANAVVGLNYQLTPIPSELGISGHKYRLTCTGNLVWVNKL